MTVELNKVIEHIRALVSASLECSVRDSQLLARFLANRDEASFAKLVARHGPMVLSVCKRVLHNHHDAEDAFQATFMILARRGGTVRQSSVASWLHTVAYRAALAASSAAAERRRTEIQVEHMPEPETFDAEAIDWRPVLDCALSQLADKYRGPIVLCGLEGFSPGRRQPSSSISPREHFPVVSTGLAPFLEEYCVNKGCPSRAESFLHPGWRAATEPYLANL